MDDEPASGSQRWYESVLHHVAARCGTEPFAYNPSREYVTTGNPMKPDGFYFALPGEWMEYVASESSVRDKYVESCVVEARLGPTVRVVRFTNDLAGVDGSVGSEDLWLLDEQNVNDFYLTFLRASPFGAFAMSLRFDDVSRLCGGLVVDPTNHRRGVGAIAPIWLSLWDVRTVVVWRNLDRVLASVHVKEQ